MSGTGAGAPDLGEEASEEEDKVTGTDSATARTPYSPLFTLPASLTHWALLLSCPVPSMGLSAGRLEVTALPELLA